MHEDVILGPGERFDVRSGALILASAIRGNAAASTSLARAMRLSVPIPMCTRFCMRAPDGCALRNSIKWPEPSSDRLSNALATVFAQLRAMFAPAKRIPVTRAPC